MQLLSPAKLNLFLRIVHRRPDGYHELASLFQAIDLFDRLDFALDTRDSFICTDPSLPTDASNLVWQATNLYRKKTGLQFSVRIHLHKKIPHQAGLGGGSSNAATTLWALNQLLGKPVEPTLLEKWAAEIGADVAFFLSQGTAYCTGRGEIVRPIFSLKPQRFWVVKPTLGTSTATVYRNLQIAKLHKRDPEFYLEQFLAGVPTYFNDLEEAAFQVVPDLAFTKQLLIEQGYLNVQLSGSGSSFFCEGTDFAPQIPNCSSYLVRSIQRPFDSWYS